MFIPQTHQIQISGARSPGPIFKVLPVKSQDKNSKSFVSALISSVKQLTAKLKVQWLLILSGTWTWYFLFLKKYLLLSFYVCMWMFGLLVWLCMTSVQCPHCRVSGPRGPVFFPPGSSWTDSCKCPPPSEFHLPLISCVHTPCDSALVWNFGSEQQIDPSCFNEPLSISLPDLHLTSQLLDLIG